MKHRLLISVRGKLESIEAAKGGAHIADVEYPASALGTPYPLNILAVRKNLPSSVLVSTNIGEQQLVRSTACQAAVGVGAAGADIIKAGLANMSYDQAKYLGRLIIRSVRKFCPGKVTIPVVFADPCMARQFIDPVFEGPELGRDIQADGLLIDTYDKTLGKCLLDYLTTKDIRRIVNACRRYKLESWIAGSIRKEQLPSLWATGVDVICIRGAACEPTKGKSRFGRVKEDIVKKLVDTIP